MLADDDQAGAAGASGGLEEIVVTATRREQSLQDVPLAVTAITADALTNANVNNLGDLTAGRVPGFVPTRFSGGSTLAISVRGVGLSDPTQGTTELTVPVYIDGVFLGAGQGLGLELIQPERVEILRGPQGQFLGRNAEGGVRAVRLTQAHGRVRPRCVGFFRNYNDQRIGPRSTCRKCSISDAVQRHPRDPRPVHRDRRSTYPGSAPGSQLWP